MTQDTLGAERGLGTVGEIDAFNNLHVRMDFRRGWLRASFDRREGRLGGGGACHGPLPFLIKRICDGHRAGANGGLALATVNGEMALTQTRIPLLTESLAQEKKEEEENSNFAGPSRRSHPRREALSKAFELQARINTTSRIS